MNSAEAPEDLHKLFVQALNSGDLDALVALYAWDGFLMARGGPARGISAIREALAQYVAMKPTIQLATQRVVQVGDTDLLMANWRFHGTATDGGHVLASGTSIEVARPAGWELALPHRSPLRAGLAARCTELSLLVLNRSRGVSRWFLRDPVSTPR